MTDQPILVAVYGSLRKGMGNHALLARGNAVHLSTERVKGWDMYSLGAFPFIREGGGEITIEVYAVDSQTFSNLDRLEGYPSFYDRELIETSKGNAWVYFIDSSPNSRPVTSGDWVTYYNGKQ